MGRRVTIPEESKTAFFEMISQGMSCLRATRAVGVSETTGRRWLKEAGITLSRGGRGGNAQTSADKLDVAATLLEQGLSPREIGEYVDLSRANISLWRMQGPDKLRQRAAALRAQASSRTHPDLPSGAGSQPDADAALGVDTTAGATPPTDTDAGAKSSSGAGREVSTDQSTGTASPGGAESSAGAGDGSDVPLSTGKSAEPSSSTGAGSSPGAGGVLRVRFHTPVIGPFHGPRSLHQVLIEDYTEIFRQLSSMGLPVDVCGALLHIAPRPLLSCVSMPDVTPLFADHTTVVGRGTRLSIEEKLTIQRLHHDGKSAAEIGRCIGRCRQTVSREIVRGQDEQGRYWAKLSHERSQGNLARPKLRKIDVNPRLRAVVIAGLNKRLSPEQISCCLAIDYAYDSAMQISHETIYQSLYVQGKGALRDELKVEKYLRTGRTGRKPRSKLPVRGKPWVAGSMISQRPEEVDDRRVPGHWEGDLIIGSGNQASALVTLVERTSRLTLIKRLGVNHEAATVTDALVEMMGDLPQALRRSLTWDQGVEMADHARFSVATDCPVYFCDPHSPWQRGSNENTNGLVRDFFPKGTNFANVSDEEVQQVQDLLNLRPRKMHGFQSAAQVYEQIAVGASTD